MSDVTSNLDLPPDPHPNDQTVAPSAQTPGPDHLAEQPSLKPVAKVAAAGAGGVALVIVVAILSGIAPGTFSGLGVWGPVVTAAVTALAAFLSGYLKKGTK